VEIAISDPDCDVTDGWMCILHSMALHVDLWDNAV